MELFMTINDVITRIDALKPNTYSVEDKIRWLSELDGIIKVKIIDTHEGGESVSFSGYPGDCDLMTELLVPAPYDDVYIYWLEAQIDYANGEYNKYNNSRERYNAVYADFRNYYNRTHMPKGAKFKFF